jgi:hypothetical protein
MKIRKRSTHQCGIIRNHLHQSSQLRHTLRITHNAGHGRILTHSNPHCCSQQHERQQRDLHLGSLHSKAVLRVDSFSKLIRTHQN